MTQTLTKGECMTKKLLSLLLVLALGVTVGACQNTEETPVDGGDTTETPTDGGEGTETPASP